MASDGTGSTGAANHAGELFKGPGTETHEGLIVVDGAFIPSALGISPIATISTLAERSVDMYAMKHGLEINADSNGILDLFSAPERHRETVDSEPDDRMRNIESSFQGSKMTGTSGFAFTESFTGFLHKVDQERDRSEPYLTRCREAYNKGKILGESARMSFTTRSFDIGALDHLSRQDSTALTGTLVQPSLRGSPFMIRRGVLNWSRVESQPALVQLTYKCELRGVSGNSLDLHAKKVIDLTNVFPEGKFWLVKSPLLTTISERKVGHEPVNIAQGVMYADLSTSASGSPFEPTTDGRRLRALPRKIVSNFIKVARHMLSFSSTPLQYPLQMPEFYEMVPDRSYEIWAADDVVTRMHTWDPSISTPDEEVKDMLMITGLAVDHRVFATGSISMNAIRFFTDAGYRVHVSIPRCSSRPASRNFENTTSFGARLDIAECLAYLRKSRARESPDSPIPKMYIVSHCLGSMALASGLLDGTIPAEWVAGITASQAFMAPILASPTQSTFLSSALARRLHQNLFGNWFSLRASPEDSLAQRLVSQALRAVQLLDDKELCNNAICHRVTFTLGRLWNHRNLDELTHRNIDQVVDSASDMSLHQLEFLMHTNQQGSLQAASPKFELLQTRENVTKLKGIPIMLFAGSDNKLFSPESVKRSYQILVDTFGPKMYKLEIVPGYGHHDCWIGCRAWRDIYPMIREEVDRVVRGNDYQIQNTDDRTV